MDDRALGFALIGIGIVFVLGIVFIVTSRVGRASAVEAPPPGVHMPGPSLLPALMSLAAVLIGLGLALKSDADAIANPWVAVPGVLLLVASIVIWVRDAGHEWRDTEQSAHDDPRAH